MKNIIHKHFQKNANVYKNYINEDLENSKSDSDSNNEIESDIDNEK